MICQYYIIRIISKLPNSKQSSKGKVKTHKYINRKKSVNNRKTGKTVMTLTLYGHFQRNGRLNQIYGTKPPAFATVQKFRLPL